MKLEKETLSRRALLQAAAALGLSRFAEGRIEPTPEVPDHDDPTPAETEGPFFKPRSPERQSLRDGVAGVMLVLEGRVLDTSGKPVAGALLDFWHCDSGGMYDNVGFKLRGHQYTDKDGKYRLETIIPGVYPGRCRHIHVKAQAPRGPILTTQLYFPHEARNAQDGLYMKKLEMAMAEQETRKSGTFDFVLRSS